MIDSTKLLFTPGQPAHLLFRRFTQTEEPIQEIPYHAGWENSRNYLPGAVVGQFAPKLQAGEMRWFEDRFDRYGIMIGTPLGNIVLFTRFAWGERGVVVSSVPYRIQKLGLISNGSLSFDELDELLTVGKNVGHRVNDFIGDMVQFTCGAVLDSNKPCDYAAILKRIQDYHMDDPGLVSLTSAKKG